MFWLFLTLKEQHKRKIYKPFNHFGVMTENPLTYEQELDTRDYEILAQYLGKEVVVSFPKRDYIAVLDKVGKHFLYLKNARAYGKDSRGRSYEGDEVNSDFKLCN